MRTRSLKGNDARFALGAGIASIAATVEVTLGPCGRNVVLGPYMGLPRMTSNGASITEIINASDPFENLGCLMIQEMAGKIADLVGDGTTTAVVLVHAIVRTALKSIAAGADPAALSRGLELGAKQVLSALALAARPLASPVEIARVAAVASGDHELAQLLMSAFERVGYDGVVRIEEGEKQQSELEILEGLRFETGYFVPDMVLNKEAGIIRLDNPYILIADAVFSSIQELYSVFEVLVRTGRPLLILADDISYDLTALIVNNRKKDTMHVVAVKAPGFGQRRSEYLHDIAALTGGQVVAPNTGLRPENVREEHLGQAQQCVIEQTATTLIGCSGRREEIVARLDEVRREHDERRSGWTKDKLRQRLAWLQGGVAILRLGAPTKLELRERKGRAENALRACQRAVSDGILPGGGLALLEAARVMDALALPEEESLGAHALRRALEEPLRLIARNAGQPDEAVISKVRKLPPGWGYDAEGDRYCDLLAEGIADPAGVTCTVLDSAVSVAALVINTDGLIIQCDS